MHMRKMTDIEAVALFCTRYDSRMAATKGKQSKWERGGKLHGNTKKQKEIARG